ncbi:A-kinase-interacting protein 1 isoform X1 [Antennarius striatus]|uniref:A-kinase-interacting protein 1 isoform X1 n=1 Tax=Antennarius striatus TaxID=241820 RepID=UPI0035B177A5
MASQAWLDSSLRRSASLGREVLERASRRRVHWDGHAPSPAHDAELPVKRAHSELDEVFANVVHFVGQTTCQCKKFYESGCCPEPTEAERIHASRFHHRPAARTTPAPSPRKPAKAWAAGEDVLIAVSPGTYAVTASAPSSRQQTKLVSVKDGESIHVTFNLTPAHTCHLTTPVT